MYMYIMIHVPLTGTFVVGNSCNQVVTRMSHSSYNLVATVAYYKSCLVDARLKYNDYIIKNVFSISVYLCMLLL